jgi:hypothetical protein
LVAPTTLICPGVARARPFTHKSGSVSSGWSLSALPPKADVRRARSKSPLCAMCGRLLVGKGNLHVACWSVQPCVRPVSAVRKTAGHNALRGSGPDQQPAFKGCTGTNGLSRSPDRPALHYVLFVLPTFSSRSNAISSRRKCDGLLVALTPSHHGPGHSGDLVSKCDGGDLGRPPRQQCQPRSMLGAMDLGITDHG